MRRGTSSMWRPLATSTGSLSSSTRSVVPALARRMTSAPIADAGAAGKNARAATAVATAAARDAPLLQKKPRQQPILLLDVMDTLVSDPFYEAMPRHFGMPFRELLDAKHPTAWLEFERGEIGERALLEKFFRDGRAVDGAALVAMMKAHYRLLDGVEPLLGRLKAAGVEMHACSNYPEWWRNVEEATALGRWIEWTFGRRKPERAAFEAVAAHLGVEPSSCVFVDDRAANVEAAAAFGMRAVRFEGCAAALERGLREHGLEF